jgi:type I restriction enzyme S subunit
MQKYDKYKVSGIEWLGDIPAHWEVKTVKHGFTRSKVKANVVDPVILSLTSNGVKIRDISSNEGQIASSYLEYNVVRIGDLLLNPMDLVTNAFSSVSAIDGVISPAYFNLKSKNGYDARYFDYYFKLQYWSLTFFSFGKGVSSENRWTLNTETLMHYFIPVPHTNEQQQIADYLDIQTAKIDELISKAQTIQALLKEKKKALINHVVTKGLNPNVQIKDSGIECLGQIPKHWQVNKLRYLFDFNTGLSVTKAEFIENGINCLNYGDIHTRYSIKLDLAKALLPKVKRAFIEEKPKCLLSVNDLVFCDTSEDLDGVGNCVVISNLNGDQLLSGSHTIVAKPKKLLNSIFIRYALMSKAIKSCIENEVTGIKVFSITQGILNAISITVPLLKEQQQIADYLDQQTAKIDELITKARSMVELLKEHKQSLIHHVITGKIKVIED